ncbi:ABC transporter permease (plasmid) [Roseovarius pelagicus]|uniref:ABC transporter permease n=1 Tax=Roseovarius pelagicus TaxID=2980108 RepID=A0ABY6D6R5_9RHOB|nr:ABC transporter permease [Roseovarius pelagicus]UXX81594.1 ABC transporter permease [Roseovarius pelagicus]
MARVATNIRAAPLSAKLGLLIILAYAIVAIFAPVLAPYGESEIVGTEFDLPSRMHPLGTDNLGRDMLSRLFWGARNTVGIALAATILAFLIGGTLGISAVVIGGWGDEILARSADVFMAIPQLVFALFLLTMFGVSIPVLIAVIAFVDSTRVFRLSRALAMNVVHADFVEVARLRGEKLPWIVLREVLPNVTIPLIAEFGLRFCFVFLLISALSFLGLGLQPPTADWGAMVRENSTLISYGSMLPLLPALAIALLTVSVNYVVDWFIHLAGGTQDD